MKSVNLAKSHQTNLKN